MPPTPSNPTIAYDNCDVISFPVGATAIRFGDICKVTSNLMVPAADNDKQGLFYVAVNNMDASSAKEGNFVPLDKVKRLEIAYTGTPTRGDSFGISDQRTLDAADATNYLLTVLSIDTDRGTVDTKAYLKTS